MPNNIKQLKLRNGDEFYPQIISDCIPNGAINASKLSSDLMNLLNGKANASDVYTKNEVYNTSEIDALISVKANADDVYTKTYIDILMNNYYTKTEVDQFLNQLFDVYQVNYNYQETMGTVSTDSEEYYRLLNNPSSLVVNYTDEDGVVHALTYIGKEEDNGSIYYTYKQPKEFNRIYESVDEQYYEVTEVQCIFTKTGVTIEYLCAENDLFELYDALQVNHKLAKKQNVLNTTNVPIGVINEVIGIDSNGDIVRNTPSGGSQYYAHYITLPNFSTNDAPYINSRNNVTIGPFITTNPLPYNASEFRAYLVSKGYSDATHAMPYYAFVPAYRSVPNSRNYMFTITSLYADTNNRLRINFYTDYTDYTVVDNVITVTRYTGTVGTATISTITDTVIPL